MLDKRRRDQLLLDCFLHNEEILVNGNQIQHELQAFDRLKREHKMLQEKFELMKALLDERPQYKRYDVRV